VKSTPSYCTCGYRFAQVLSPRAGEVRKISDLVDPLEKESERKTMAEEEDKRKVEEVKEADLEEREQSQKVDEPVVNHHDENLEKDQPAAAAEAAGGSQSESDVEHDYIELVEEPTDTTREPENENRGEVDILIRFDDEGQRHEEEQAPQEPTDAREDGDDFEQLAEERQPEETQPPDQGTGQDGGELAVEIGGGEALLVDVEEPPPTAADSNYDDDEDQNNNDDDNDAKCCDERNEDDDDVTAEQQQQQQRQNVGYDDLI